MNRRKTESESDLLIRYMNRVKELSAVAAAAVRVMETLGNEDGYFPTAGVGRTDALRDALLQTKYRIDYGSRR